MQEEEIDATIVEGNEEPAGANEPLTDPPALSPLEEAVQERDQYRAMAQRAQADLINYKRRADEQRQELVRNAASRIILQLLPVLDDFQRALEHLPTDAPASWGEGIQMILRKLQALLESEGVRIVEPAVGDALNPFEHEAVFHDQNSEQATGTIVQVVNPGYLLNDRVLRPAQVTVAYQSSDNDQSDPSLDDVAQTD